MALNLFIMNTDNQFSIQLRLSTCYLHYVIFYVKKMKFTLEEETEVQRESTSIALLFL